MANVRFSKRHRKPSGTTKSRASTKAITLFTLMKTIPRELRDQIYTATLRQDADIPITNCPIPPLLLVCRQIYYEALPIFYSCNTFRYIMTGFATSHMSPWVLWLNSLSPLARASLKTVIIQLRTADATRDHMAALYQKGFASLLQGLSGNYLAREIQNQEKFMLDMQGLIKCLHRSGELGISKLYFRAVVSQPIIDELDQSMAVELTKYKDELLKSA